VMIAALRPSTDAADRPRQRARSRRRTRWSN